MKNNLDYLQRLRAIGWNRESDDLKHQIAGESCHWFDGQISGVEQSAWIGTKSRKVYLHCGEDFEFDAFCELVREGWPVIKVARAARGLFDGDDE